MRIVMMGTGPFAVPTFEHLVGAADHEVVALFTRPVPAGKRRQQQPVNPMRDASARLGVPVCEPSDVNSPAALTALAEWSAELLVVCDYGQILSNETLHLCPLGGINLHGSLLPKYRGAAPVNWSLYHGDPITGVTVIHMTPGLDAGPCLVRRDTAIRDEDDAVSLESRLAKLGPAAVSDAIEMLVDWDGASVVGELQDPALATRAPRLRKTDGRIDWNRSARDLLNQIRAFKPWPGSFTFAPHDKGPRRIIVDRAVVVELDDASAEPGTIVESGGHDLFVQTGAGGLAIAQLQPAGKRSMEAAEFLRGHPLRIGQRLGEER